MPADKIEKDACVSPYDMLFFCHQKGGNSIHNNNLIYHLFLAFWFKFSLKDKRLNLKTMAIKGG